MSETQEPDIDFETIFEVLKERGVAVPKWVADKVTAGNFKLELLRDPSLERDHPKFLEGLKNLVTADDLLAQIETQQQQPGTWKPWWEKEEAEEALSTQDSEEFDRKAREFLKGMDKEIEDSVAAHDKFLMSKEGIVAVRRDALYHLREGMYKLTESVENEIKACIPPPEEPADPESERTRMQNEVMGIILEVDNGMLRIIQRMISGT